jgi:hypothetical protein
MQTDQTQYEQDKARWWSVLFEVLTMSVENTRALTETSPVVAARMVESASNIADAALNSYRRRFPAKKNHLDVPNRKGR